MKTMIRYALLALAAVLLAGLHPALVGVLMAEAFAPVTAYSLKELYKKEVGRVQTAYNFLNPEFGYLGKFPELVINASGREMYAPLDVYEENGVNMITDGGRESTLSSVTMVDGSYDFVHANARLTISLRSQWLNRADGGRGVIVSQLRQQGLKKVQAMGRVLGIQVYGYNTGIWAQLASDPGGSAASHTLTLKNGMGDALISGVGATALAAAQRAWICRLFKKGDRIALIRTGALVANAIGQITAHPDEANGQITVSWLLGNADPTTNDNVVLANAFDGSTIDHTSYGRTLVGLLQINQSATLHGVDGAVVPAWNARTADTTTGPFTGMDWRAMVDDIQDFGDEEAEPVTWCDKGVYRQMVSQHLAGVQYNDTFGMEINGEITANGRSFRRTRNVPPGMVFVFAKGEFKKKTVMDLVRRPPVGDLEKVPHESAHVGSLDWFGLTACTNRKVFAMAANKDRL